MSASCVGSAAATDTLVKAAKIMLFLKKQLLGSSEKTSKT